MSVRRPGSGLLPIFVVVVVDLIGFGLYIPLLPFYAESFNAEPWVVGLAMATYSFTQFLSAPLWGQASDRHGRKPVLALGMAGSVVSYVWLGFADGLTELFLARALNGLMAGNIAAAFAYVADTTTRETRARGMGLIGAAFGLGFIAGPAIGGLLAGSDPENANFVRPAMAAATLSGVAFLLTVFWLPESRTKETRALSASGEPASRLQQLFSGLSTPGLGGLLILILMATFVFAGLESTFAMWSRRQFGWGPEQNGYLFAGIGIMSALIQGGLIGRLTARFGEKNLVVCGATCLAVGVGMLPFAESLGMLILAMAVAAFGFSVMSPALNALVSLQVTEDRQGSALGLTRSAATLARILGPAFAGSLFSIAGMDAPYFAGAAIMAVVAGLALYVGRSISDSRSLPERH
ncbi:MAG: MFS transporter [Rhodospirillales bacterium]